MIIQAFAVLLHFLLKVIDAIVGAILYALPWLIRLLSIVGWLFSAFTSIQTVSAIYSPFSDNVPVIALQSAVIVLAIIWAMSGLLSGKDFWGMLIVGALTLYAMSYGANQLMNTWQYAQLFFRILPVSLLAVGMIYISIRVRTRRMSYSASAA